MLRSIGLHGLALQLFTLLCVLRLLLLRGRRRRWGLLPLQEPKRRRWLRRWLQSLHSLALQLFTRL